jgi:hypothetical protein
MSETMRERFIQDRVRAMATVVLTRRSDLTIVETKQSTGLDYHVIVDRDDKSMRLKFGLLLRGVPSPVTTDHANRVLGPTMDFFRGLGKFTYPVCLFLFTMQEEQAYFSWLAEPVVTPQGPKLVHRTAADCVELTTGRLDAAVEQVVAWYDAFELAVIS